MMSVASRPRVKRHRSISVDDWKYFDQYRAFRPNPLVRLSILAPGTGPDRKRSDIVLQTSDRRPASSLTFRLRCVFPILYLCYLCDLLFKILSLRSSVRRSNRSHTIHFGFLLLRTPSSRPRFSAWTLSTSSPPPALGCRFRLRC